MNGKRFSTHQDFEQDDAPDLSTDGWPEKFAKAAVHRGRPPLTKPKVSTTIRLSQDVLDHFKAHGRGWQTRINEALREWIQHSTPDKPWSDFRSACSQIPSPLEGEGQGGGTSAG